MTRPLTRLTEAAAYAAVSILIGVEWLRDQYVLWRARRAERRAGTLRFWRKLRP